MKKLCFIVSSPMTAEVFLKNHFEVLKKDYEIYLIANLPSDYSYNNINLPKNNILSVEIYRNINLYQDFLAFVKLVQLFKLYKFDLIQSVTPKAGLLSSFSGFICGLKFRIHFFTGQVWANKRGVYRFILKNLDLLISKLSTDLLVDSHSQLTFLVNEKIVSPKKAKVLSNGSISGVSLDRFQPIPELKDSLRNKYKLENNTIVFIFMGRLNKDKGIYDLVEAFNQLYKNNSKNCSLFIIGPDEGEIKGLIEKKYEALPINFLEFTSTPEKILQLGDVFCLPSYREGFGTSVIEASSIGLPVICSNIYGLKDAFIEGKTGLSFQLGNIEDLKNKMLFFIRYPQKIQEFGSNGVEYVRSCFSANLVSNSLLNFYNKKFNDGL